MATVSERPVLSEVFGPAAGAGLRLKQAALVILGVAALAVAAKISVPKAAGSAPPSRRSTSYRRSAVNAVHA